MTCSNARVFNILSVVSALTLFLPSSKIRWSRPSPLSSVGGCLSPYKQQDEFYKFKIILCIISFVLGAFASAAQAVQRAVVSPKDQPFFGPCHQASPTQCRILAKLAVLCVWSCASKRKLHRCCQISQVAQFNGYISNTILFNCSIKKTLIPVSMVNGIYSREVLQLNQRI